MARNERLEAAVRDIKSTFRFSRTRIWEEGSQRFRDGKAHSLESSDETPRIVVEPDNAEDVAKLLKLIGKHKVAFAVNQLIEWYYGLVAF